MEKKFENADECRKHFLEATGRVIARKRKHKNITQKELGEVVKVDGTTIGRYEKGIIEIPSSSLPLISGACDFSMRDYLAEWEDVKVEELVREALTTEKKEPDEDAVQYVVDTCTEQEYDRIRDIGIYILDEEDPDFKKEVLQFTIEYHIKNKQEEEMRKRLLAYYERITGKRL